MELGRYKLQCWAALQYWEGLLGGMDASAEYLRSLLCSIMGISTRICADLLNCLRDFVLRVVFCALSPEVLLGLGAVVMLRLAM